MELSSEEEQRIREEIRAQSAQTQEEKRRKREQRERSRRERASDRQRQRIFEEEERQFYEAQGLKKYFNRHGGVEWLMPEEIRARTRAGKERYRIRKKEKWKQRWMVSRGK